MADMSFCGAIAVISGASHLFRGTLSVGQSHLLGTQLLRAERTTALRFFHAVPWSDPGSWMAAPVNPPKNVYILDKSAAYGQIRCRLARYRQSDPKVQRLMLKLEQHQPISSSGVASNLSRAPGAYPQSSHGAENSGQQSSYKNLKHWGPLHRQSLSLSSHPWRPGGSPNAAWKALGGVNEISSLDREQLQERESCEEVRCKEEESWILVQEEDRRARCIACGVMSNLQLLEGIHTDLKQRQSESGKAHVCQRRIAPVKPGNLSPPWPPPSLLKSGDTSRIGGRAPWRRVGAGETHQTFSDRNGCAFCGPKAQANIQALPHPGTHQEPGNGNVSSQHSSVYPATSMLVIQDQGEKMMQQDLVGEKVQLMPATVLSEMGSLATDQYKIGKDIDNLAQGVIESSSGGKMGSILAKPFVGGMKGSCPLSEAEATNLLCTVKGWRLTKDGLGLKLQHDWRVKNLLAGMQLLQGVAMLASIEQHYPDLSLYQSNIARVEICSPLVGKFLYKSSYVPQFTDVGLIGRLVFFLLFEVSLSISWKNGAGGLTENDFILAAKIDGIYVSDLIVSREDKFGIKL